GVELAAGLFGDDLATGEDRDVFEHRLAAVTEARGLDAEHVERAAQLVHDQRGERLTVDVLGDDDEVLGDLHELLEHGQDVRDGRDLLVGDEDVRVFDDRFHPVGVGDEVRRDVTAVDLHALDELRLELQSLGLFDRDDALASDLVHDIGDELADLGVSGGDGRDLRDLLLALHFLRVGLDRFDDRLAALLEAALQEHRVGTRGDVAHAFVHDGLREDDRRGRAVTGDVVGLGGSFLEELRAHVLERVLELDLASDGDAVVGHGRRAELLVKRDVATLRPERGLHGVGHDVDALLQLLARLIGEYELLCHVSLSLFLDAREDVLLRQDQVLLTIELEFGSGVLLVEDALALLELDRNALAVIVTVTGTDREDAAFHRLFFRGIGKEDPTLGGLLAIEGFDDHAGSERLELDLLCDCWHSNFPLHFARAGARLGRRFELALALVDC